MEKALGRLVWNRANAACEYCRLLQAYSKLPFEIDHIIAKKHGGKTTPDNLALSCFYCNSFKGASIAGIDPRTHRLFGLFNPRRTNGIAIFVGMAPYCVDEPPWDEPRSRSWRSMIRKPLRFGKS